MELISREAAIDAAIEESNADGAYGYMDTKSIVDMLNELPSEPKWIKEIKLRAEQAVATFCEASLTVKKMPTIDPVKHGRWTGRRSIAAPNRYECSVCKRMTIVDECIGEPMYAYCPWCGAELKGEE